MEDLVTETQTEADLSTVPADAEPATVPTEAELQSAAADGPAPEVAKRVSYLLLTKDAAGALQARRIEDRRELKRVLADVEPSAIVEIWKGGAIAFKVCSRVVV